MNAHVSVYRDDLVGPVLTPNSLGDRRQVRLGSDICAYLTADDVRDIAAAWAAIAQEIDASEIAVAS